MNVYSWTDFFKDFNFLPILKQLKKDNINNEVIPNSKILFDTFKYCDITNIKVILWGINFHSGESRKNILIKKICDNENTNVKDYDFTSFEFLAKQGAIILDDPLTFYKKQENHKMLWKSFYNYLFEKIHIINNNICILNTNNVFNYKTQIDKQTFDFKSNDTINKLNLYLRLSFNEALCFQKKQYEKKQEELNNLDKNSTNYEYRRNLIMDYDDNMTPF